MSNRKIVVFVGITSLFGAGGGAVATELAKSSKTTTVVRTVAAAPSTRNVADSSTISLTPAQIYKQTKDSVAYITAEVTERAQTPFGPQSSSGTATGSGFVVSSDGLIVTNAHVIDGATSVTIELGDRPSSEGEGRRREQLVGSGAAQGGRRSRPRGADLGDSSTVQVGDSTAAIGNPFGLDRTLTTGVVSAVHRTISAPNGIAIHDVLQTDAALNPGNSGGPLLDAEGHVIGVNSQIESSGSTAAGSSGGNTGVGFAVPSNTVKRVVDRLRGGN